MKNNIKERKWIIIIGIIILFNVVIQKNTYISLKIDRFKYEKYTNKYESINKRKLVELTTKKGYSIIFIGSVNCPDCIKEISAVNKILKDYKTKGYNVYYYNTNKYNQEEDIEVLNRLDVKYIPTIMITEDGNISLINYDDIIEY